MPIRIRDSADPLSERALRGDREVIIARSAAARVLSYELIRYCNGHTQGRSFLIAGHRGAGKTTMVADALYQAMTASRLSSASLRPLPVFLHGPSLLETLPSDLRRDDYLRTMNGNGNGKNKANGNGAKADKDKDFDEEPAPIPAANNAQGQANGAGAQQPDNAEAGGEKDNPSGHLTHEEEKQAQLALVHLILSLHRAVVREYTNAYRQKVLRPDIDLPGRDAGELAAQFEIELLEDPPASRLREYWQYANAMTSGILFHGERPQGQGARELVAINGICNAHQRISGALSETERHKRERTNGEETSRGFDAKAVEALKPLGAIFAGVSVTGGVAVASNELLSAGLLGVLTAWLSSMFLKSTSSTSNKRERLLDRVFIPDLTPRTLDRVLPILLDRLRAAGLAPVLVIDELDKVDDLARRIDRMIRYLKKLMAENVFSCFLTDRGYMEHLRMELEHGAYDRASSYFSHRILVAYEPKDIDAYLSELLEATTDGPEDPSTVDREVLKWVLRHRSQLHALTLNRELAALRGDDGRLNIPHGDIRDEQYSIDVTLQMAIELQLYSKDAIGWSHRQPAMQQTLFDTLYFLSRSWLQGERYIDLSPAGKKKILEKLTERMNLDEAYVEEQATPSGQQEPAQKKQRSTSKEPRPGKPLNEDDMGMLCGVLEGVVRFLLPTHKRTDVDAAWEDVVKRLHWRRDQLPVQEVMSALLLENKSLLMPAEEPVNGTKTAGNERPDTGSHLYEWRYWRSGGVRNLHWPSGEVPRSAELKDSKRIRKRAHLAVEYIEWVEHSLLSVLVDSRNSEDIQVFSWLSDRCRVLSTTPAWSRVRAARANLALVEEGAGNKYSIEEDCRAVQDFEKVLRDAEVTLLNVVLAAAVLCGVSANGPRRLGLDDAIEMLSAGLGFARLDPPRVAARAKAFWEQLRRLLDRKN